MNKVALRMKAERELGLVLQITVPEIKDWCMELSNRVIAERIYADRTLCGRIKYDGPVKTLMGGVRRACIGSTPKNSQFGPFYEGLFKPREHKKMSRKNRERAAKRTCQHNNDTKTGYLFQAPEELSDAAIAGVRAKGQVPWADEERAYARELKSQGLTYKEISVQVNAKKHHGEEVRTRNSICYELRPSGGKRAYATWTNESEITDIYTMKYGGCTHREIAGQINAKYYQGEQIRTEGTINEFIKKDKKDFIKTMSLIFATFKSPENSN